MSSAAKVIETSLPTTLKLVEKPPVKTGAQCLAEIRDKLNAKARNPAYIFDCLLTSQQRETLCFAAGLKRADCGTKFVNLATEKREAIKNAILFMGELVSTFRDAHAMQTHKFTRAVNY